MDDDMVSDVAFNGGGFDYILSKLSSPNNQ